MCLINKNLLNDEYSYKIWRDNKLKYATKSTTIVEIKNPAKLSNNEKKKSKIYAK